MPSSSAITGRGPAAVPYKGGLSLPRCSGFSFQTFIKGLRAGWTGSTAAMVPEHSGDGDITSSHCDRAMSMAQHAGYGGPEKCPDMGEAGGSWGLRDPFLPCYLFKKSCPLGTGTTCHLPLGALGSCSLLIPYLELPQQDSSNNIPRAHRFPGRRKSLPATFSLRVPSCCSLLYRQTLTLLFLVLFSRDTLSALTHCDPLPAIIWEFHQG